MYSIIKAWKLCGADVPNLCVLLCSIKPLQEIALGSLNHYKNNNNENKKLKREAWNTRSRPVSVDVVILSPFNVTLFFIHFYPTLFLPTNHITLGLLSFIFSVKEYLNLCDFSVLNQRGRTGETKGLAGKRRWSLLLQRKPYMQTFHLSVSKKCHPCAVTHLSHLSSRPVSITLDRCHSVVYNCWCNFCWFFFSWQYFWQYYFLNLPTKVSIFIWEFSILFMCPFILLSLFISYCSVQY